MPGSKKLMPNGKWKLEVCSGFRADGKQNRMSKTVGPCSAKQAEKLLQELYLEFSRKPPRNASSITFEAFTNIWMERHERKQSPNTQAGTVGVVRARLLPYFGKMKLGRIKGSTVMAYIEDLEENGLRLDGRPGKVSAGTVHDIFKVLRSILNKAVEWNYIASNPCNEIPKDSRPKAKYKVKAIYEDAVLAKVLLALFSLTTNADNVRNALFMYLALITGCRSGELLALSWGDIDLVNFRITVCKDIYVKDGRTLVQNRTKGNESRNVYIDVRVVEMLIKHKHYQEEWLVSKTATNPNDFVFVGARPIDGEAVLPCKTCFYTWFRRFTEKNGLPHIDLHGFRRMAASYAVNNNVPITAIQNMLGHKDIATTGIYLRTLEGARKEGAQVLSDVYAKLLEEGQDQKT